MKKLETDKKTITLKLNELEIQALRKATLEWKKTMNNSYKFVVRNPINKRTGEKKHDFNPDQLQFLHFVNKATQSLHRKVLANTRSKI